MFRRGAEAAAIARPPSKRIEQGHLERSPESGPLAAQQLCTASGCGGRESRVAKEGCKASCRAEARLVGRQAGCLTEGKCLEAGLVGQVVLLGLQQAKAGPAVRRGGVGGCCPWEWSWPVLQQPPGQISRHGSHQRWILASSDRAGLAAASSRREVGLLCSHPAAPPRLPAQGLLLSPRLLLLLWRRRRQLLWRQPVCRRPA